MYRVECIFCSKIYKKNDNSLRKFTSFEERYARWKNIKRSLSLENIFVYRKVQGKDLWSLEAKFHNSCLMNFRLKHSNMLNCMGMAESTFNSLKTAHSAVLNRQIIEKKEILQLNLPYNF